MAREFNQIEWDEAVEDDCRQLIRLAIREDLDRTYDWTTLALVSDESRGRAAVVSRQKGTVAGLRTVPLIFDELDASLQWTPGTDDASRVDLGTTLGIVEGSVRDLLVSERLVLNLLGRLSGVATATAEYVDAIAGTQARIYDTRKTTPGYRRLEKYAVRCGGGQNHRTGLFDAVLIKDNHLAFGARCADGQFGPGRAVHAAREFLQETLPEGLGNELIIEIEVDTIQQLIEALPADPDIVLLDNMEPTQLARAVSERNVLNRRVQLEASGNVNLTTIRRIAESGVDRVSVGAITHSAPSLDVGLDWIA